MPAVQPEGYLALPDGGQGRPVLVLHPWWGLNQTIRQVCNRLAAAGFVAFAPDLYKGAVTDEIAEADRLSSAVFSEHLERARADAATGAAFLHERSGQADGLAVMGFSLGAFFALDLSEAHPDLIESVVVFYGTRPGDYGNAKAAYLGHFAQNDHDFEPLETMRALEESLGQAGRPATFYLYPGVGHWFFEPDRADAYDAAAAGLAWERTLAFLGQSSAL